MSQVKHNVRDNLSPRVLARSWATRWIVQRRGRDLKTSVNKLVWGDFCQEGAPRVLSIFLYSVSLFDLIKPVSSPRPNASPCRRAQERSRLARLRRATVRLGLEGSEHGGMLAVGRDDVVEGSRLVVQRIAPTCLYAEGFEDPNHDAAMRICGAAPKRRDPFSDTASKPCL